MNEMQVDVQKVSVERETVVFKSTDPTVQCTRLPGIHQSDDGVNYQD